MFLTVLFGNGPERYASGIPVIYRELGRVAGQIYGFLVAPVVAACGYVLPPLCRYFERDPDVAFHPL